MLNIRFMQSFVAAALTVEAMSAGAQSLRPNVLSSVRNEQISFSCFSAFPDGAKLAVVVGDPKQAGPYVVRVSVADGVKLMPHVHPEDRVYTVISGVFYIGFGTSFDSAKLVAYGPGSVIVLPHDTAPFPLGKVGSLCDPGEWSGAT